jgi:O-antigen/teichoic acid export membrane protein
MSVSRTIAKNTFFNFVATASDVLVNLVVGIVLARKLGTDQYGLYAFLMWFLALTALVSNLGLGEMVKRFIAEALGRRNTAEPTALVRMALSMRAIAALVLTILLLVLSGFWARAFADADDQIYFVILAFALLPNVLNFAFISIFAGFQKFEYAAYLVLSTNPLRAAAVISLAFLGFGMGALLTANIIAWVLGVFVGFILLRRLVPLRALRSSPPLEQATKRRAVKYAMTMCGVLGVNYFLWAQAEVLFLGLYQPVEVVGFYTLAAKMPVMVMQLVPIVFGMVLLPAISEQFGRGDMDKLRTIYLSSARFIMILALPLAAAGIALARPIIGLLYGADYEPVVVITQVLFVPFAMWSVTHATTAVIYGVNQPAFVLKVGLLLLCLGVGLNLWLIPWLGAVGAATASSVPRLLVLPIYIYFVYKRIGVSWPVGDTLRIALACSVMGVVLFVIQNYLGMALGLALAVPVGLPVYVVAILTLGTFRSQDIHILEGFQGFLPSALRKHYEALMGVARWVLRTKPV